MLRAAVGKSIDWSEQSTDRIAHQRQLALPEEEPVVSRRHEIPTHLDVEDRLFAGLTPRQLLLLCMGIGLGYSVWQRLHHMLPVPLVLLLAIVPALVGVAFATIRPEDRPLEQWLLTVTRYAALPKVCILGRGFESCAEEGDLSAALEAVEAEWAALREASGMAPARKTDEWGLIPPGIATRTEPEAGLELGTGAGRRAD